MASQVFIIWHKNCDAFNDIKILVNYFFKWNIALNYSVAYDWKVTQWKGNRRWDVEHKTRNRTQWSLLEICNVSIMSFAFYWITLNFTCIIDVFEGFEILCNGKKMSLCNGKKMSYLLVLYFFFATWFKMFLTFAITHHKYVSFNIKTMIYFTLSLYVDILKLLTYLFPVKTILYLLNDCFNCKKILNH